MHREAPRCVGDLIEKGDKILGPLPIVKPVDNVLLAVDDARDIKAAAGSVDLIADAAVSNPPFQGTSSEQGYCLFVAFFSRSRE
jgi:hypothetical protein